MIFSRYHQNFIVSRLTPIPGPDPIYRQVSYQYQGTVEPVDSSRARESDWLIETISINVWLKCTTCQCLNSLKLDMHPGRVNIHQTPVGVIAGVFDMLIIGGQPSGGQHIQTIEKIDHPLGPIVDRAIADESVYTP